MPGDLILVYFLEKQVLGTTFIRSREDWPMHLTLVPWFSVDSADELVADLRECAGETEPFSVTLGKEQLFNPETRVSIVDDKQAIGQLHDGLLGRVVRAGAILRHDRWIQGRYKPHVTHHQSQPKPKAGDTYYVDGISLVTLLPGSQCKVIEHFPLHATVTAVEKV